MLGDVGSEKARYLLFLSNCPHYEEGYFMKKYSKPTLKKHAALKSVTFSSH